MSNTLTLAEEMTAAGVRPYAVNAIANAGIVNKDQLRESIENGRLFKCRNCGATTINDARKFLGLPFKEVKSLDDEVARELSIILVSIRRIGALMKLTKRDRTR